MTAIRHFVPMILALTIAAFAVSTDAIGQSGAGTSSSPHEVRTAKFTVDDVDKAQAFYEEMFDLTEINRFVVEGMLVEPLLGYADAETKRIGLLGFTEKENLEKNPIPVVIITVANFDQVIQRLEDAKHGFTLLSGEETGGLRIAMTVDPSGNGVEIIDQAGASAVAGSRLIVDDLEAAEEFFVRIFGATPGQRFQSETSLGGFDEVIMNVGGDMIVALFESKGLAPLPKSEHPVVAIYSTEFDAVLERVKAGGLGHREFGRGMLLANDPSGNVVEVVRMRAP